MIKDLANKGVSRFRLEALSEDAEETNKKVLTYLKLLRGEISPDEFQQFIAKDIRLVQITIENLSDIKPTLEFYMGKNTPERKTFIMQNLVNENG